MTWLADLLKTVGTFLAGILSAALLQKNKDARNAQDRLEQDNTLNALGDDDLNKRLRRWQRK